MIINLSKTKELVICFRKDEPNVPQISLNSTLIDQVSSVKLLGVYISSSLKWATHVDYIYKKASSRVYFIIVLRRSGVHGKELFKIYSSIIRPVLEYGCQIWHSSLTKEEEDTLESIQKRCFKVIWPELTYTDAITELKTDTLFNRRETICLNLFKKMKSKDHKLNFILPEKNSYMYSL